MTSSSIRERLESDERKTLSPFAMLSEQSKGRVRPAPQAGVHAAESRVQHIFQLAECEIRNGNLADAWNDDESLARDVQRVRPLGVSGENEDDAIAGAEAIAGVHRSGKIGIEL